MLADPAKTASNELPWSRPRGKVLTRERERESEISVIVCECIGGRMTGRKMEMECPTVHRQDTLSLSFEFSNQFPKN